jgi:hypothetical protein
MKARERTGAVWDQFTLDLIVPGDNRPPVTVKRIILAIEQAIIASEEASAQAEREACAMIADEFARYHAGEMERLKKNDLAEVIEEKAMNLAKGIARRIRDRS